jgi:hypothetical protein
MAGTINPEILCNKDYSVAQFKYDADIMDDVLKTDFREFLQRTKPNFKTIGDSTDHELLESLSELVNNNVNKGGNICKDMCNDIQENLCSSMCNKMRSTYSVSSRVVIGGVIVSLTAALGDKMRAGNRINNISNDKIDTELVVPVEEDVDLNNDSDEVDVIRVPHIIHIKKGWFW